LKKIKGLESQESKTFEYRSNDPKKKKKSEEQCELNANTPCKVNEKFESNSVKKIVQRALKNTKLNKEYQRIQKRIEAGVAPIEIGNKSTNLPGGSGNNVL
jgi:hypothetical protein